MSSISFFFFFQAEDGIRDHCVTEFRRVLFRSNPATDVGPLISDQQKARVERYIALGEEAGCKIAFQGEVPGDPALAEGHWVAPVIFTEVTNDMRVAREEIF